jgi:hypothetical protein
MSVSKLKNRQIKRSVEMILKGKTEDRNGMRDFTNLVKMQSGDLNMKKQDAYKQIEKLTRLN